MLSLRLKRAFIFTLVSFIAIGSNANTHISLKLAMARKIVSLKAISTGGYMGKSIKLAMTNNTPKEMTVDVDPGLIFVPQDTSYQDLVLMGGDALVMAPCQSIETNQQTFCGKSYAYGPVKAINYTFKKQGDSNMVKMLVYAREKNVPIEIVQHGVWMFTNGHCLPTVYSKAYPRESEEFVQYLAALKKISVPRFYIAGTLENRAGRSVTVTGRDKTYLNMHWKTEDGYRNMHLAIFKENGEVYKKIEADQVIDKYGATVQVEFDPHRDPRGRYTVKLYDDGNKVWDEKTVLVSDNPCDNMN